jgi:methyl-accepting chemotaxis protein
MKSMTIGKKLFMSFGAALALTLGLAYSSLRSLGHLSAALDTALNQTARGTEIAGQMDTSAAYLRTGQRGVILYSILKEPGMVKKSQDLFTSHAARIDGLATGIEWWLRSEEARRAADTIRSSVNDWQPLYQEVVKMSSAGRFSEINPVVEKTIAIADRIQAACERIAQAQREDLAEAAKEGAATSASSRWIAWILVIASLGVGGLVLWLVRQISRGLRQVVGELSAGADQTSSAAGQVSSSSQSLAPGASEHAASLEETSASVEEINSMASRNSENSRAAANLVTRSQEKFVETNRSLEQMELAMDQIHTSSDKISKIFLPARRIQFRPQQNRRNLI